MPEYLTREEAEAHFRRIEDDFDRFKEDNKDKAADWWDSTKTSVRDEISDMRKRFDEMKDQAPDAWDKFKSGVGAAMDELEIGYRRAIREFAR